MCNYELIEKLVNLENRIEELEGQITLNFVIWLVFFIGSALFFIGCLACAIYLNHKYGDL